MHYYTHNIGQFAAETRFMTPEEVGVYVILKDEYYATGMRLACDRIANLMPPQCEGSLKRVLQRFFHEENGFYVNDAFEAELDSYKDKGSKNRENAKKRWEKKRSANESDANGCESHEIACGSDANGCLTNNQELITNNQIVVGDGAQKERTPLQAKNPAKQLDFDSIPDDWKKFCEDTRPDLDPQTTFADFRFYWLQGQGKGTRRSDRGWNQTWANWVKKERPGARKPNGKDAATEAFLKDLLGD